MLAAGFAGLLPHIAIAEALSPTDAQFKPPLATASVAAFADQDDPFQFSALLNTPGPGSPPNAIPKVCDPEAPPKALPETIPCEFGYPDPP